MTLRLEGAMTALVTPFRDDAVDIDALRKLVESQIEAGIDALVVCGTTGESPTLKAEEFDQVIQSAVAQAKSRVPVVAGAGAASTAHAVELSLKAKRAGANALLWVCPYYNKPTQTGLEMHFRTLAREVGLPAMLYNIPSRTGVDLQVSTLARLSDVPEIVAVKESTGTVSRTQAIVHACGERFALLSGEDALTLPIMAAGGKGVVSVSSNLRPKRVVNLVRACQANELVQARKLNQILMPLHQAMFLETNPIPVKAGMTLEQGHAPEIRLPLTWAQLDTQNKLAQVLNEVPE